MQTSTKDLILDISVNLARVSDWTLSDSELKKARVEQFLNETKEFVERINENSLSDKFRGTFLRFKEEFKEMLTEKNSTDKEEWAEKALTWANILQHRSALA